MEKREVADNATDKPTNPDDLMTSSEPLGFDSQTSPNSQDSMSKPGEDQMDDSQLASSSKQEQISEPAGSDSQTSPNSIPGEVQMDDSQLPSSSKQEQISEEQKEKSGYQKELKGILKKLKKELPEKNFNQAERLVKDCINNKPTDPKDLLQILKYINALQQKSDKANSSSSTWWWFSPPVTVKVYTIIAGQTFHADKAILDQVKSNSLKVETTQNQQECDIIFVFCSITSRVGADVEAAMTEVSGDKPVVLVLMHHTRNVDYSTDVKKWSEHYQNVKLDVHVLFHESQQGLLKCARNDEAVRQIQGELKRQIKSGFGNK